MRFELAEEHESFRKVVRGFAEAEIGPHAAEWDQTGALPISCIVMELNPYQTILSFKYPPTPE